MKKTLLVILGAGSSVSLGMPSVSDLDLLVQKWSREWASGQQYPDYFEALRQSVEGYYGRKFYTSLPPVTFEKVLGEMLALSHWMTPSPWGDSLRNIACDSLPPPELVFPEPDGHGPAIVLRMQLDHILTRLAGEMRSRCLDLETCSGPFLRYSAIFDRLRESFHLRVFNLNYDSAALRAIPRARTGFSGNGAFSPSSIHACPEGNSVYHLHGSVHFSLVQSNMRQICWRDDLAGPFVDTDSAVMPDRRSESRLFPVSTLLAGGFKLDQLLAEPFQSFHAALIRDSHTADAILIGGYGFGDAHVNHALRNRLSAGGDRPPVVILDRRPRGSVSVANDHWAAELSNSLRTNGHFFHETENLGGGEHSPRDGAPNFEVAREQRIALWNGGFVEGAERIGEIGAWLDDATKR